MHISTHLFFSLLAPLHLSLASPATTNSNQYQRLQQLQRPISFSPPSPKSLSSDVPTLDEHSSRRGTLKVPYCVLEYPLPINFSVSSQVCLPLIGELPYIISDVTQRLLSEHLAGIPFPISSDSEASPLPIHLGANMTEQIYRSKFVLSLALKLSPLKDGVKEVGKTRWRSIIGVLEQSALELDREARKSNGAGLGNLLVLEVDVEDVHVLAGWKFWRVVDGEALMCEK